MFINSYELKKRIVESCVFCDILLTDHLELVHIKSSNVVVKIACHIMKKTFKTLVLLVKLDFVRENFLKKCGNCNISLVILLNPNFSKVLCNMEYVSNTEICKVSADAVKVSTDSEGSFI